MLGDEKHALDMASALFEEGIYVIGFAFPLCPRARRIRVQISVAHTKEDIESCGEVCRNREAVWSLIVSHNPWD